MHCERSCEMIQSRLRCVIGEVWQRVDLHRGGGGNVDNSAAALIEHMGQHVFAGQENAGYVGIHDPVPILLCGGHGVAHVGDADVVVKNVDSTPPVKHFVDHA